MPRTTEQGLVPNPLLENKLYEAAIRALSSTLNAGRDIIVFSGAGQSLQYGGVTWADALGIILKEATARIDSFLSASGAHRPLDYARLQRISEQLSYYSRDVANLHHDDRMAALEVANYGLNLISKITGVYNGGVNRIFAEISEFGEIYPVDTILHVFSDCLDECVDDQKFKDWIMGTSSEQRFRFFNYMSTLNEKLADSILEGSLDPSCSGLEEVISESRNVLKGYRGKSVPLDLFHLIPLLISALHPDCRRAYLREVIACVLEGRVFSARRRPRVDQLRELTEKFGISRFITLNYDWVLEDWLMVPDLLEQRGDVIGVRSAVEKGEIQCSTFGPGRSWGELGRWLPTEDYVVSDVYEPMASGRLFDFALGGTGHHAHILHLHGRVDFPETMVARLRDYERNYLQESARPRSLQRALDVTLSGNPVMFVGVGMSEPEITNVLRRMVAEGDASPSAPVFVVQLLQGSEKDGGGAWRQHAGYWQRFGIHVLHAGHPRRHPDNNLPAALAWLNGFRSYLSGKSNRGTVTPVPASVRHFLEVQSGSESDGIGEFLIKILESAVKNVELSHHKRLNPPLLKSIDHLMKQIRSAAIVYELRNLREKTDSRLNRSLESLDGQEGDILPRSLEEMGTQLAGQVWSAASPLSEYRQFDVDPKRAHFSSLEVWRDRTTPQQGADYPEQWDATKLCNEMTGHGTKYLFSEEGGGRGVLVRAIWQQTDDNSSHRLLINCKHRFEIDSVIGHVYERLRVLLKNQEAACPYMSNWKKDAKDRLHRIGVMVQKGCFDSDAKFVLILSGLDRLFSREGYCLSADFERFLRILINRNKELPFNLILVGGAEFGAWVRRLQAVRKPVALPTESVFWVKCKRPVDPSPPPPCPQLTVLDHEIVSFMTSVGAPIDWEILKHCPAISKVLDMEMPSGLVANETARHRGKILSAAQQRLLDAGKIVAVRSSSPKARGKKTQKFALKRSVMDTMRRKLGVQLGDELLANSFSLTLAYSLPVDVVIPDPDVQRYLDMLIGRLREAWRDGDLRAAHVRILHKIRERLASVAKKSGGLARINCHTDYLWQLVDDLEAVLRAQSVKMDDALRASSGIVRTFFNATTLVANDPTDRQLTELGDTPFEAQLGRIRKLLSTTREYETQADLAAFVGRVLKARAGLSGQEAERLSTVVNGIKAPSEEWRAPLYGCEKLWLHNERGVIALIQGDLNEAQFSFDRALQALRRYKGNGWGHSRVRIEINRSKLLIERGHINLAGQALLDIRSLVGSLEVREQEIVLPHVTGGLGFVAHLAGRADEAFQHYGQAIDLCNATEQLRAAALFRFHRAALHCSLGHLGEAQEDVTRSIQLAEAGRQLDVLWQCRLLEAAINPKVSRDECARQALDYAKRAGLHRISVQALTARMHSAFGQNNLEAAADFAAKAMALASRNGMTLRTVSLRIHMGRIMWAQGDENGIWLIRRGVEYADSLHYQSAVQRGQAALIEAGLRRVS